MTSGEIRWVDMPPSFGHEQMGRRPAIVMQDDGYAERLPLTIIIPLTSSEAAAQLPGTLKLSPTSVNGLSQTSVALVFQIRATDRRRIYERLGVLEPPQLSAIHHILDQLLGRR